MDQLFSDAHVLEQDAVVALLAGTRLYSFSSAFRRAIASRSPSRRPVLVTGYNGLVFEKHLEGLLWRVGYDIICVNSRNDLEHFGRLLSAAGASSSAMVCTGLPLAQWNGRGVVPFAQARSKNVLFAPQAVVPDGLAERAYLLDRLCDYAYAHPDRKVLVKQRTRPGERTFHVERHSYAVLAARRGQMPSNLEFVSGDLQQYLGRVGLVLTVSSTAAFEALAAGVHAVILTDLGVKESLGNHFFIGSGALASMNEVVTDELPQPNVEWLANNGLHQDASLDELVVRVRQHFESEAAAPRCLPLPEPFYDERTAPFVVSQSATKPLSPRLRKLRKLRRRPLQFLLDAFGNAIARLGKGSS